MFVFKRIPHATSSIVFRSATTFASLQGGALKTPPPHPRPDNNSFDLSKLRIYRNQSVLNLVNMLIMNTVCTKDLFVDNCHHIYRLSNKLVGPRITEGLIGGTMGRIFTAGNSLKDVEQFIANWPNKNINLYIDYANEAAPGQVITQQALDENTHVFCETIKLAAKAGSKSGIAIKVSALCLPDTLMEANKAENNLRLVFSEGFGRLTETMTARQVFNRFSELGVNATLEDLSEFFALFFTKQVSSEADLDVVTVTKFEWLNNVHAYNVQNPQKTSNKIITQLTNFTPEQIAELDLLAGRLHSIFKRASEDKCNVLVDAEQTYLQTTIDFFTIQFSEIYNKQTPIVLNTFQNYLKSTRERVSYEIERCKALNIPFGAKLVRGAYMVEERRLAKENGYASPIHDSISDTHQCYNDSVLHVVQNWVQGSHLIIASHNEESVRIGQRLVKEYNITPEKGNVSFIQLLGLADHLTYSTAEEGFTTAKYCPFGPISIMIPYLIRRAQESKQMLGSASLQRTFVLSEIGSRLRLRRA